MFETIKAYGWLIKIVAILAIVGAVIGSFVWFVHHERELGRIDGRAEVQKLWNEDKITRAAAEKKAMADRLADNAKQEAAQVETNQLLKKGYANEQAADRAIAAKSGRMLYNKAGICGDRPAASQEASSPSGSPAETPATGILPEPYAGNIDALMLEADLVVASCRAAQTFITGNGLAP